MKRTTSTRRTRYGARSGSVSRDDLKRIVGDVEDSKVIEILALNPTLEELEEAAVWASGDGDILAKSGHPLTGITAQIVDILTADEDEPRLGT